MSKIPSSIISRWADFGYDRDSWQESLLDFLYFIEDETDPNTPLPGQGEACIIGHNPVGDLAKYSPNDVLFHSTTPDTYFIKKPEEVRVMVQKETWTFWFWSADSSRWYSAGSLSKTERIFLNIPINSSVWNTRKIELSRPVLSMPPVVYLAGCGELSIDINYWMPDASTITFDPSSGPDSLGNFPVRTDKDILLLRYFTSLPIEWGG